MAEARLLLCTDMDRTVIPNGAAPEDTAARPRLRAFCARPEVTLVYVTGRDQALVKEAITTYALPPPDFVVTDVGTMLYHVTGQDWSEWTAWSDSLARVWPEGTAARVADVLSDTPNLTLQEASRQNRFKVSYYGPCMTQNPDSLLEPIRARIASEGIEADLIYSIDEHTQSGLLDILPVGGTKRHAIEFIAQELKVAPEHVVFAGDSGNDLPMAESVLPFILVANAMDSIKTQARQMAEASELSSALYVAQGGPLNMNGNYAAGVLEGVWHFLPDYRAVLEQTEAIP